MMVEKKEIYGDDYAFLRSSIPQKNKKKIKNIRLIDLFCGCGGISLGIVEACKSLGYGIEIPLAVDFEKTASDCYKDNFPQANVLNTDISELMSSDIGSRPTKTEQELIQKIGKIDILVGGPPCQGHSDLNNRTRRNDPKNKLYIYMVRAAELFKPDHLIIENVPGALHDKGQVVQSAESLLEKLGYKVDVGYVDIVKLGVPQNRRRLILIGSKIKDVKVQDIEEKYGVFEERDVNWAISDLIDISTSKIVDQVSATSPDNKRRINYLFDNDIYDLPNEQRPPCHRDKKHSYVSIYGRMHGDKPSQTITSGFYNCSMGRYVHPSRRRTLTAHEAARIQFFPDYFNFENVPNRTALAKIIGNAVPMKLPFCVGLELLSEE